MKTLTKPIEDRYAPFIIGINPGTSNLGLAILQGNDLRDWRVKVFDGKWSMEKLKKIERVLNIYFDTYHFEVIALKKLHQNRSSKHLELLVTKICEMAKSRKIRLIQLSNNEIKHSILQNNHGNKKRLSEVIATRFPLLYKELEQDQKKPFWKSLYHARMFEAVALALICYGKIESRKG